MKSSIQRLLTSFCPRIRKVAITDEVRNLLEAYGPVERALESVEPRLSPEIIKSIVQDQISKPNPQLGLRFFTWTMRHDRLRHWECYNSVLGVLLKDNGAELDRFWGTLEEIKKSEAEVSCCAFQLLIEGYSKLGMHEKAVETFGKLKDFDCSPNVHTYNKLLVVILQKELFLLALAVYSKMKKSDCLPNCDTYVTLIDGFRRGGQINNAIKVFDEMLMAGVSPNVFAYTSVIIGLCQSKNISNALKVVDTMRKNGCRPSLVTWNGMLSGSCKGGKVDEALVLLQVFVKEGYAVGLKGYSCVIDGLFSLKRYDEAVKWYEKLLKVSKPDIVLYGIMIRGYAESHRFDEACSILNEMTDRGILPNTYCYNALIKGYCDAGLLKKAHSLKVDIARSDNCSANAHTYTILICSLCRNGLVTSAENIFKEMEEKGCLPAVVTFNSLMHGLCNSRKFEEARKLFSKMEIGKNPSVFLLLSQGSSMVPHPDSDSLKLMVEQYCDAGLYFKAYKLLMKLSTVPDITTYNTLMNGFCKAGNTDAACKLFRELRMRGLTPDSVTYGTLIDGFFRANDEEAAFKVLDMMVGSGCSPTSAAYKSAMTWSCRKNKVSFAFSLWLKFLKDLPLLQDQDHHELVNLAEESFAKGEVGNAIRAIIKLDLAVDHSDIGFYNILLVGMCQAGRVKDSFGIFSILKDFNVTMSAASCTYLIRATMEAGNLDLAVQVFFYTLEKGFQLKRRICNELFQTLLDSQSMKHHTFDLIDRMKPVYDLHHHFSRSTKDLLLTRNHRH